MTAEDSEFEPVKSASRVLELLELLTRSPDGLQFMEIMAATGWPRSSLYGLLRTMSDRGHLDLDEAGGRYRIGLRIWEAGRAFVRAMDLAAASRPHLERARDLINETVQLAILDGFENVYVAKVESSHHLRLQSEVGSRLPAYSTGLGKVLLAGLPPVEFERRLATVELVPFTDATITDPDVLRVQLAEIRGRGYALDEGAYTLGVFCVAVPVHGMGSEVVAAISSSVPTVRALSGTEDRMVNGLVITKLRVNPLIATLGMLSIVRGLGFVWTDARTVVFSSEHLAFMGRARLLGNNVPVSVLFMLAVFAAFWFVLRFTVFGRFVYALGGSERAAVLAGLPVASVRVVLYVLTGLCAGLAGLVIASQLIAGSPQAATNLELLSVTAAVLGGASLSGGEGRVEMTLIGVLIMGTLTNGLVLLDISSFWQMVATGLVLVVAVALDGLRRRY